MKTKLLIILFIAAILRIWQLDTVPPHLSPDEAALGYNAFSVLQTGKDEHGEFFPLIFKSFGDYKPGLYVYLVAPFIKVLGLTELAVRLPSALMGVLAVFLIFKLVQQLQFKLKNIEYYVALLLAVNPWHIVFSRGAWEANVALTLTLLGILLFLYSFKRPRFLLLSSFVFGSTLVTYQGAKLTTAITVALLLLFYGKQVVKLSKKTLALAALIGLICCIPIVMSFIEGKTGRLSVFSVFAYPRDEQYIQDFIDETGVQKDSLTYMLFYNEPLNFFRGIMGRYFNHFSGRFLFIEGDWQNPMFSPPYHGMLTVADLSLFIVGVYFILKNIPRKNYSFVLLWLLLAPLPAILSRDQIQAVRSLHMIFPLTILLSFGIWWFLHNKYTLLRVVFVAAYAISYLYFLDAYFVHFPKSRSNLWGYGYKEVMQTIAPLQSQYATIKIEQSYAQPYIYYLFYTAYDPAKYQTSNSFIEGPQGDVGFVTQVDNIYFGPLDYGTDLNTRGLVVAKSEKIPRESISDASKFQIIKNIEFPRGARETGFIILSVQKNENK